MDIWVFVVLNENMFVFYFREIVRNHVFLCIFIVFCFTLMMLTFDCAMEFITIQLRNMPFQTCSSCMDPKTPQVVETIEGKSIVVVTNPWYT